KAEFLESYWQARQVVAVHGKEPWSGAQPEVVCNQAQHIVAAAQTRQKIQQLCALRRFRQAGSEVDLDLPRRSEIPRSVILHGNGEDKRGRPIRAEQCSAQLRDLDVGNVESMARGARERFLAQKYLEAQIAQHDIAAIKAPIEGVDADRPIAARPHL